jgi:hypothetical protein
LDSALDPVIAEAAKKAEPEQALLSLKICDPACGSGHFLIAAAHRLAKRLATVRTGDTEPSPEETRTALRDVIGRCIFGVDINPMAVELCKVSLWMEAIEPGKPLSFLDHHIQCGNSLLGATPALIARGIPDAAYKPITGDDKKIASQMRKDNKEARDQGQNLFDFVEEEPWKHLGNLPQAILEVEGGEDDDLMHVEEKATKYQNLVESTGYENARLLADAWCAAFVWPKDQDHVLNPLHSGHIKSIEQNPHSVSPSLKQEVRQIAKQYQFLHWHLAFPQVFQPAPAIDDKDPLGWEGGFDCVLGNPPWERVKLQEKEWFAERDPDVVNAPNAAARKRKIKALIEGNPALWNAFQSDLRMAEGGSHFIRDSARFPLCGRGDVNTYTIFAEGNRQVLSDKGRAGFIVPSGIATDDTTKFYFQDIVAKGSLVSLYSFENEEFIFPGIHHATRFCLVTVGSGKIVISESAEFIFFARQVEHLREHYRKFRVSSSENELLNPNSGTCPIFRSRSDAELTKAIYRRVRVLIKESRGAHSEENPWGISFLRMFDMANDSHLFCTRDQLEHLGLVLKGNVFEGAIPIEKWLPLYEAKMIHHFDHRWGTYEGQSQAQANQGKLPELDEKMHANPYLYALPRYWVKISDVNKRIPSYWNNSWFIGFRDITGATVLRTAIASICPTAGFGHTNPLVLPAHSDANTISGFYGNICSFIFDYSSRQKIGGTHLTYSYFKQLPFLSKEQLIKPLNYITGEKGLDLIGRVLELHFTCWDLASYAKDQSYDGPPFRWDDKRRFLIRCELDSAFFHLYLPSDDDGNWKPAKVKDGAVVDESEEQLQELKKHFPTPRDAVAYIMETFPIVKRKDEKTHGSYRTKDMILDIYDSMLEAQQSGKPYQTRLDPPPGDIRAAHLPELPTATRSAFPKSADYVNYFIYALVGRSIGGCSLKVMTRAFNLLRDKSLSASTLSDVPSDLINGWRNSFKEQLSHGDLSSVVKQLVERGALSPERDGEDLKIRIKSDDIPDMPPWVGLDADLSLRAALADIARKPEMNQVEETEYSEIYKFAQSA